MIDLDRMTNDPTSERYVYRQRQKPIPLLLPLITTLVIVFPALIALIAAIVR